MHGVNPSASVTAVSEFVTADNIDGILGDGRFDYCIDAIDDLKNKILLITAGEPASIAAPPLVMGAMIAGYAVKRLAGV